MAAIAASRRAHAADSTRAHASTAPAPETPAVAATNESNMHSNLRRTPDARQTCNPALWMNHRL